MKAAMSYCLPVYMIIKQKKVSFPSGGEVLCGMIDKINVFFLDLNCFSLCMIYFRLVYCSIT